MATGSSRGKQNPQAHTSMNKCTGSMEIVATNHFMETRQLHSGASAGMYSDFEQKNFQKLEFIA